MIRTAITALAILASVPASAGMTCSRLGTFTNCTNTDTGETYTGSRIGRFDNWRQTSPGYHSDGSGDWMQNRQTCSWVGNFYVCN